MLQPNPKSYAAFKKVKSSRIPHKCSMLMVVDDNNYSGDVGGPALSYVSDDDDDDNDKNSDIYIMMKCVFVTKNDQSPLLS